MRTLAQIATICILGAPGATLAFEPPPSPEQAALEANQALSAQPNLAQGKEVFRMCAVCHTPEGWGTESGQYPQIAGQHPSVLIKQLADIRALNRDNPTMRPFTSPRTLGGIQQMADVAAYIAQLPMSPHNGIGPGNDLAHGERLYKDNCAECHGEHGQGNAEEHIPRIEAQHYRYLVRQFEWIQQGKRRNADAKMVRQIQGFSPRDIHAVLDYTSRLRPPADRVAADGWQNPDFPRFSRQHLGSRPAMQPPEPPQPPERLRRPSDPAAPSPAR